MNVEYFVEFSSKNEFIIFDEILDENYSTTYFSIKIIFVKTQT